MLLKLTQKRRRPLFGYLDDDDTPDDDDDTPDDDDDTPDDDDDTPDDDDDTPDDATTMGRNKCVY